MCAAPERTNLLLLLWFNFGWLTHFPPSSAKVQATSTLPPHQHTNPHPHTTATGTHCDQTHKTHRSTTLSPAGEQSRMTLDCLWQYIPSTIRSVNLMPNKLLWIFYDISQRRHRYIILTWIIYNSRVRRLKCTVCSKKTKGASLIFPH